MLAAVAQHGCALQYAAEVLRADKEVVLAAMAQDVHALYYAVSNLRADEEMIQQAVTLRLCARVRR